MAYKTNRIAGFEFIAIEGEPDETAQAVSIDSWAGVDGMEFTDEGRKGIPFAIFTIVDCNDLLTADITCRAYKDLIGQGSVTITKDGELLVDRFKVLTVTKLRRAAIQTAVGNKKSAQAGAILECRWELVAVPA